MLIKNYIFQEGHCYDPIDVIIPASLKDVGILPLCIQGIKTNCVNPIVNIYVIGKKENEFLKLSKTCGFTFIDEKDLLGFDSTIFDIQWVDEWGGNHVRNGWLYQQIIKLSGLIGLCDNFLCLDADLVVLKPMEFVVDGIPVFYVTDWQYHLPYYKCIHDILGYPLPSNVVNYSFISDKMVFNKQVLQSLKTNIYERTGLPWMQAIYSYYDRETIGGFSEYETYGQYFLNNGLEYIEKKVNTEKNVCGTSQPPCNYAELKSRMPSDIETIVYHNYNVTN